MATVMNSGVGQSVLRKEDAPLIIGQGRYVDDIKLPGMAFAAFVRSPHAHAAIKGIDSSAAEGMPGVVRVLTAANLGLEGGVPCASNPFGGAVAAEAADPGRGQGAHARRAGRDRRRRFAGDRAATPPTASSSTTTRCRS